MKNAGPHMDQFVRYGSLSSMCNKLSYYASDTSSSFLEAKNEIENLTVRMEELYNSNLNGKKVAGDGATSPNQVRDPNIVKTKEIQAKLQQMFKKEDDVVDVKEWVTQFERVQNLEYLKIVISVMVCQI